MSGPTHMLADGTRVFPEGYRPSELTDLTDSDVLADRLADAMGDMRAQRARLLGACDFTQLPDAPLSVGERLAWANYRQALRDLPQTANPLSFEWPAPPEATP